MPDERTTDAARDDLGGALATIGHFVGDLVLGVMSTIVGVLAVERVRPGTAERILRKTGAEAGDVEGCGCGCACPKCRGLIFPDGSTLGRTGLDGKHTSVGCGEILLAEASGDELGALLAMPRRRAVAGAGYVGPVAPAAPARVVTTTPLALMRRRAGVFYA
jgi:hypothetical protein